jgi:hypothetical protein
MAILQRFRKVTETDREVEYAFGFPEMDRQLTIDKVDRSFRVADGSEDHASRAVLTRVTARAATEGAWPDGGAVQA